MRAPGKRGRRTSRGAEKLATLYGLYETLVRREAFWAASGEQAAVRGACLGIATAVSLFVGVLLKAVGVAGTVALVTAMGISGVLWPLAILISSWWWATLQRRRGIPLAAVEAERFRQVIEEAYLRYVSQQLDDSPAVAGAEGSGGAEGSESSEREELAVLDDVEEVIRATRDVLYRGAVEKVASGSASPSGQLAQTKAQVSIDNRPGGTGQLNHQENQPAPVKQVQQRK